MRLVVRHVYSCLVTSLLLGGVARAAQQPDDYSKQLENIIVEKIVNEHNEATTNDGKPAGKKEIGKGITKVIKEELKESYLQFLASSDLATWSELQTRFNSVEEVTRKFREKYAAELNGQATTQPVSNQTQAPAPAPDMTNASASPIDSMPTATQNAPQPMTAQSTFPAPDANMTAMNPDPMATAPAAPAPVVTNHAQINPAPMPAPVAPMASPVQPVPVVAPAATPILAPTPASMVTPIPAPVMPAASPALDSMPGAISDNQPVEMPMA